MRHRHSRALFWLLLAFWTVGAAQSSKEVEQAERARALAKPGAQRDRAGGTHDKSNIGHFFENRGKLYPATIAQGVSGEWPIRSGHEYIYRANPVVGRPGNVIAGRFRTSEEWEAAAGYNNRDSAKIAFSDKPQTWPATGWIVKDAAGKPVFVSDQDSYAVYNDSTNRKPMLGLEVHQIGYAFGAKAVRDMIYFTYKIVNRSQSRLDSLYFGLYLDIDIGDVPGGAQEYADDRIGFDKQQQAVYFYDDGVSSEWPGANTGYFGFVMVSTPSVGGVRRGITDLHYNLYDDDAPMETDSVHFGILSSAPSLYNSSLGPRYFHPGANAPDLHFDDMNTIPVTGMDLVSNVSSGPYVLNAADTLTFVTVFVAGNSLVEFTANAQKAHALYEANYVSARPPDAPKVAVLAGDKSVRISWDNSSELSRDFGSGLLDFEGYRLYKSVDRGLTWDQIDRNQFPSTGPDPVPLGTYDKINTIAPDKGLQYSYVDSAVVNGFEYWYTVTAYDAGDSTTPSLESPRGGSRDALNLGIAIPQSSAIGRTPVLASNVTQTGTGTARVQFSVQPMDIPNAGGKTFDVAFAPTYDVAKGNLRSSITVSVDTVKPEAARLFALAFASPTAYRVFDLQTLVVVDSGTYVSGAPIRFNGLSLVLTDTSSLADARPEAGDSVLILPGLTVVSGGVGVLSLRPLYYGTWYVTDNGVVMSIVLADAAPGAKVTYADRFRFTTAPAVVDPARVANELDLVKVVPNPYLISSLYEEEFGTRGTRREPIRQLKFNHLPPTCTIYIFTIDGDKVVTIEHNATGGTETWNMRAAGNREIAPGVYIYMVKTDTAEKIGRFAVIK
jgi:hypothetical protein